MKFSEKWLREWINPKIDSNTLKNQISNSGIEVEQTNKFKPIFQNILVGKIIKCIPHSKTNKLKILKIDIGIKKLLNIVCGASNCRNGIKVAVAIVGAILPNKLKINIKNIQGEQSEGMLCSFFELGLFFTNKIIEFSQSLPIGTNVSDYLLLEDNIIKITVTPNRPDGLSILGLSRNISAINNLPLPILKDKLVVSVIKEKLNINIQAQKACTNCIGRIIKNINTNIETPFWMKKKLFLCEMLSENIITNIINYTLIEIGQPINIINSDNIDELIIIRMSKDQEEIILKNDVKIFLNENILVLSDRNKILSIPGNIHASMLEVNNNTKNVFLSSLLLNKKSIFYILQKFNSNKILEYYNHGIDPLLQNYAIEYATDLIVKLCGGEPGPVSKNQVNASLYIHNTIRLYHANINQISGIFIDEIVISNILYSLNYQFIFKKTYWDVISPSWRFDILIEEDVINDILRIYGYNNICMTPLTENLNIEESNESRDLLLEKARIILVNKGYYEVINYSFIDPKTQNIMFPQKQQLLIANPISQDMSCMRFSLWPGLLKIASYNTNRKQESIRFFESGLCFSIDKNHNLGVKQEFFLGAVISGNYFKENWYSTTRKVDFYDLKGDLESILESIYGLNNIDFKHSVIPGLHPEQSAEIYLKNNFIGSIGAIDPRIEQELNVNSSTFLFEISLNHFVNIQTSQIQKISKFPTICRDIAILVSNNIPVSDIINKCKNMIINQKVEIHLFDVYSCKEFSNAKKSLGIRFIFQDSERTLTEKEINLIIDNCIGVLKKTFQVILRK